MNAMLVLPMFLLSYHSFPLAEGYSGQDDERALRANIGRIFDALDTDRDGCISKEEWIISVDRLISTSAKDDLVDRSDFRRQALHAFEELDLNHDGCLSTDEYLQYSRNTREHLKSRE